MPVRVLVAPDKFRGTADAAAAAAALAVGLRTGGHTVEALAMSDGGEGFLDALGGANRTTVVSGPLGDPVEAAWRYRSRVAVIEMARAAGLELVGGAEHNDAVAASTRGVGELMRAAVEAGARRILIGLGGSATTDGGLGALEALGSLARLRGVRIEVACDVRTGFVEAAEVFAPQKGASPAQVELLTRRLERLAQLYEERHDVRVGDVEMTGAAGGLAGGLLCVGAELVPGAELVADHLELEERIDAADLVLTGEGLLDAASFDGKVVGTVAEMATALDVPTVAVVGDVAEGLGSAAGAGRLAGVVSLVELFGRDRAFDDTTTVLAEAAQLAIERFA